MAVVWTRSFQRKGYELLAVAAENIVPIDPAAFNEINIVISDKGIHSMNELEVAKIRK